MTNLGGPQSEVLLTRVAANIGGAVDAVEAFWGTDWPRDIDVVATGSQRQFEAEAGGGPAAQWADIAAIAVAERVDPARRIAIGQRIVFAPGAAGMSEQALRIVLSHELFHYAARADTAVDAPRWLTEGVAVGDVGQGGGAGGHGAVADQLGQVGDAEMGADGLDAGGADR